jgi:polyhydroxyalkanoate synthesis regulator phasin
MNLDEMRKTVEATLETLTPARAQQLAKGLTEPGAAKDQVTKAAADILQWSQRSRERLQSIVRREIQSQLRTVGLATKAELDALTKRVRTLERGTAPASRGKPAASRAKTPSSRGSRTSTSTTRSASKTRAKRPAARSASA